MAQADIHQAIRVVGPYRQVAHAVGHEIVHAMVPLQGAQQVEVAAACERVVAAAGEGLPPRPGQGAVDARFRVRDGGDH
ncbi:hypothetical protein D3C86_1633880 [compost metagenome]